MRQVKLSVYVIRSSGDDDELEVHDIGPGGAGDEESSGPVKEAPGIVVEQGAIGVGSGPTSPYGGRPVDQGAGSIGGAVVAVGPGGEQGDAGFSLDLPGKG